MLKMRLCASAQHAASINALMENDVYNVKQWAEVLIVMSGSDHVSQLETLHVIGTALHGLGETLREQFKRAMELAHPPA